MARKNLAKGIRRGRPKADIKTEKPHKTNVQKTGLILAALGFLVPFFFDIPGLDPLGERMLSIFIAAIVLWVTEAVPLVATAVAVIFAEVLLVSDKALFTGFLGSGVELESYRTFFAALADPVIILFLGGFMLADGAAKYKLDKALAGVLLKPFLGSPRMTLLGLMGITALLSMFMSNTATTATMFAVIMPVLAGLPKGKARTGVALSIPVAANVGGIGTPVGTPPNAIALGALEQQGITVSFVQWMGMAVPLMLVILAISWWWLAFYYIPKDTQFDIDLRADFDKSTNAKIFYVVAAMTILLWMTEPLHGISSNVVGFLPVVVLLFTQVMTGNDLKKLDWPVLWLVSGGIALGKGVGSTGLDSWLIGSINWSAMPVFLLLFALAGIGFLMSNVISHSASANLLIPLGVGLGTAVAAGPGEIAVILALGCSLGMCLPISTPPNAIAYSTGEIPTKQMAITGIVVGVTGVILLAVLCPWQWGLMGVFAS